MTTLPGLPSRASPPGPLLLSSLSRSTQMRANMRPRASAPRGARPPSRGTENGREGTRAAMVVERSDPDVDASPVGALNDFVANGADICRDFSKMVLHDKSCSSDLRSRACSSDLSRRGCCLAP